MGFSLKGLVGIVLAGTILTNPVYSQDKKPRKIVVPRIIYEPVYREEITHSETIIYRLGDFLENGEYEIRYNKLYSVTTDHNVSNNIKEYPYLDFVLKNNNSKHRRIYIDDFDKTKKYKFFLEGKTCTIPVDVDLNEKIPSDGKKLADIAPDDIYAKFLVYTIKVIPPKKRVVWMEVEEK